MFSLLGYIDSTSSENGYWCDGCVTSPGQPCRVKPSADDEAQSGDLCGTCSGNACLHSPNYDSSNDQDPSTCDIGKISFEHNSKLINKYFEGVKNCILRKHYFYISRKFGPRILFG